MIRSRILALVLAAGLLLPLSALAKFWALPGTTIENLSTTMLRAGVALGSVPDFAVDGTTAWLLTADNRIVDLGSGKSALPKGFVAHSFARTRQGSVAVISEDVLGTVTRGLFLPTIKLPYGNMRVAAGPNETLLLFGGPENDQVLISYDGPSFSPIVRIAEPIGVVTHAGDRIFFTTGSKLFTAKWGEAPALVFLFPDGSPIVGAAVNATSGEIYLATADAIYALDRGVAFQKVGGMGGGLQFRDGALYVLDAGRGLLMRVRFP